MDNKNIKHFLFGLVSGMLIIPVIDELLNVIMAWIQVLLLKPNKIVLNGNKELSNLQEQTEYQQSSCIGFHVDTVQDDYEDEDERD